MRLRTKPAKPPVVHKRCETCWTKRGVDLWDTSCYCTGSIVIPFRCPGTLAKDIEPSQLPPDKLKKTKSKKDLAS